MHDPSTEPDLRVLAFLERLERPLLLAVALVSGGVLALWLVQPLAALAPVGWSKMVPGTAAGMLLAVASLALSAPQRSRLAVSTSKVAALALVALGVGTLLAYSAGVSPRSGTWLQLSSPQTALGLALAGICLALIRSSKNRLSMLADVCAVALVAFALFLLAGHVFRVVEFVGLDHANLASPQTVLCFLLLSFVIVVRRATEGVWLSILVSSGIGSRMMRTVLPGVVAMPFLVFALIGYLDDTGSLAAIRVRAIAAPLLAIVGLGVVGWMGQRTNVLERQLRLQSLTDELTNVFNRRGFEAMAQFAVHNARRSETGLTVFYFDLDGLKEINDTVGHEAGSRLIKRFAEHLVFAFRKNDVVARVGGDEFVVLAVGASEFAQHVLTRLEQSVADHNASEAPVGKLAYSAGYAELLPQAAAQLDAVVGQADKMMYEHKLRKKAA